MNLRGEVSWDSLEQQFGTHLTKTVKGLEKQLRTLGLFSLE